MKQFKENVIQRWYDFFVHAAFTTTIFQLICPIYIMGKTIRLDVVPYIGVLVLLVVVFCVYYQGNLKNFLEICKSWGETNKCLGIAILAYWIWDITNVLRAQVPIVPLDKYLMGAKLFFLFINIIFYSTSFDKGVRNLNKIYYILINWGITSSVISVFSWIAYFTDYPMMYDKRISLIADYNVFSTVLMLGFVGISFTIINSRKDFIRKAIYMIVISTINIPILYLSGSRRTILLLAAFILFFVIYCLIKRIVSKTEHKLKDIAFLFIAIVVIGSLCQIQIAQFSEYSAGSTHHAHNIQEGTIEGRMETIEEGSALDLRFMIWEAAVAWIGEMDLKEILIGGGGSYSSDVYDRRNDPINSEVVEYYGITNETPKNILNPHNFILNDMLEGGIIKVILLLVMLVISLKYIIDVFHYDRDIAIMLLWLFAILFATLMMSAKNGIFGNRMTWILYAFLFSFHCKVKSNQEYLANRD